MDFAFSPEERKFKQEVDQFLIGEKETVIEARKELDSGTGFGSYVWDLLRKLGSRGWLCPTWPKEYGGLDLPHIYRYILTEEIDYYIGNLITVGAGMAGPVVLARGSDQQKNEYLPRIARGEIDFALGYTEPQAGSDVASLEIRAEDKGDYFLMNGQKMFNTRCHYAQYHWLGARTRVTEKKHQGISLFIVDFKTPGISLSPLWTVGGMRTNQVFYDNVQVPKDCLVGEANRGFYYIMEALDYERIFPSSGIRRDFQELVDYVKRIGKGKDPLVRQKLAELAIDIECANLFALRTAWILNNKRIPTYEPGIGKILRTETEHRLANTALQIFGHYGQLNKDSKWASLDGLFEWKYRDTLEYIIAGGTSEILRNVTAQRGLGLPRG
ncbi:MAG: acyl-CoA dehydrogenase family protein [Chloroflexota bacterium]|nr:acyl-CoA dehydrogenase family protein [Chloroflexota bacterium]